MLPDLSLLRELSVGVDAAHARTKRARSAVNYAETFEPEEVALASTISEARLPGPLKISNAYFVGTRGNIRKSNVGLIVIVTNDPVTQRSGLYEGARIAYHPFEDKLSEPEDRVIQRINAAVIDVKDYWDSNPGGTVLVHCNAGQNRSAAVVLAIMLSYGVPKDLAVERVLATQTPDTNGPGVSSMGDESWEKFTGDNGKRLLKLVSGTFPAN